MEEGRRLIVNIAVPSLEIQTALNVTDGQPGSSTAGCTFDPDRAASATAN